MIKLFSPRQKKSGSLSFTLLKRRGGRGVDLIVNFVVESTSFVSLLGYQSMRNICKLTKT